MNNGFFNKPILVHIQILVYRWGPEQGFQSCYTDRLKQSLACLWCRLARLTSQHTRFSPAWSHLYFILYSQCNRTQFHRLPTVYINLPNNMIYFLPKCFFHRKACCYLWGNQKRDDTSWIQKSQHLQSMVCIIHFCFQKIFAAFRYPCQPSGTA